MTDDPTKHADELARILADYFGENWATMNPLIRDRWRLQAALLLEYVRQTAFGGLASRPEGTPKP